MTKLILALDLNSFLQVRKAVKKVQGWIDVYKVGMGIFTHSGPRVIKLLKSMGEKVFLDLKFFDIPSVVKAASENCLKMRVDMFNLHTLGGYDMLKQTRDFVMEYCEKKRIKERPKILGVTILTSLKELTFAKTLGLKEFSLEDSVIRLSILAKEAGLDGVVASPREVRRIKMECGENFIVVCPGIRLPDENIIADDQERTLSPKEAASLGADYIVVGRPILQTEDPIEVIEKIQKSIKEGWESKKD